MLSKVIIITESISLLSVYVVVPNELNLIFHEEGTLFMRLLITD